MFNLFGSLFFGNRAEAKQEVIEESKPEETESLNTKETTGVQTQTTENAQQQNELTDANQIKPQTDKANTSGLDWVIVDRSEEADKCESSTELNSRDVGVNTSMIQSMQTNPLEEQKEKQVPKEKSIFDRDDDDNDIILGSFFEKNQNSNDDGDRYKTSGMEEDEDDETEAATPNKDWLITPLPCLTSITASQRSIENDPLENLLIEHPSMSVFVTATSSSNQEDEELLDEPIEENNCATNEIVIVMQSNEIEKEMKKSQAEKRKGRAEAVLSISPCSTLQRNKRGKRNKKSPANGNAIAGSNSGAGKENLQVRTLLLNDAKKPFASQGNKLESFLLNKNQMKRNNKNSTFKATKYNVNSNQRKYHKLQQPTFLSNFNY